MSENKPGYSYRLVNIECMPGSTHFNIVMELEQPIADLLPYLAAAIPACTYTHDSGVINVMDRGHIVGIYGDRVTITDVSGPEQAEALCRRWFDTIARVRADKDRITPVLERREKTTVLDIFRDLPGTNCGRCGLATCLAFAAAVFRRERSLEECPELPA